MNLLTIITAVIIIGLIWGGFVFFISRAVKFEKMKKENAQQ